MKANNKEVVNIYFHSFLTSEVGGIQGVGTVSCLVLRREQESWSYILVLEIIRAFS